MADIKKLDLNDPDTKSADIVAGNVEALKALFPEAFTEGKIDFEVLKGLLGAAVDERDEKYGLNWHGKRRARQIALSPSTGTLLPCPEESVDWDTTQNLMIEGDNLEVLKLLQKSYAGKVKLIYIDPPYNTGKDFVYPDDFRDSMKNYLELTGQLEGGRKIGSNTDASGRFHTDWLSMMYPRLRLARTLLRPDGLIFVSVDDTEAANLKQIMSDIFGEENFLAAIAWEKRYTRSNNAKRFYSLKDTIIVFRKSESVSVLREARTDKSKGIYSNPDNDDRGDWTSSSYVNPATKAQRPNLVYPIQNPLTKEMVEHPTHAWKYEISEHQRHVREDRLWWGQKGDAKFPRLKNFLEEMQDGVVPIDLWDYKTTGTTDEGGAEVKALFEEAVFDNPKPTKLVQRMLGLAPNSQGHEIIIDFFAGSGTTGHAVMKQNATDEGNRRYILVQLPEPVDPESKEQKVAAEFCKKLGKSLTIAELTKERLRRAAAEVRSENPMFAGDTGFRVFKLAQSNIRAWEPDAADLESSLLKNVEHLVQGRKEQDVLYELLLKLGLDLCVPIEVKSIAGKSVHSIGGGALIVCLADGLTKDVIEPLASGIVAWRAALAPAVDTRVVFKDSGFADDIAKTNMAAILNQNGITDVRSL